MKRLITQGAATVVVVVLLVTALLSVSYVPVNSVGTKVNRLQGTINEEPLASGVHVKKPWEKVSSVSTELRSADIDDLVITTKDAQSMSIDIELQYRIDPTKVADTYRQFKSVKEEDWIEVFAYQRIQNGVQAASSQYTIIELMGEQRSLFQADVDKAVAEALTSNHMILHTSSVDDMKASESIKAAIEENAKQKQAVVTAQQEQEEELVKNETKIAKAKADAQAKKIAADAEAYANEVLSNSIDTNIIKYKEAEARMEHGWLTTQGADAVIVDKKGE